ncbi:MAG: AAA family ATPase [Phycisphaeraceae bacterium]
MIALMNQKGGVGKTTTTVNVGAALARGGHRVLLIDLDPQAHLTLHLGVEPDELERSVYDLLTDPAMTAAELVHQLEPNLGLLPAEVNLAGVESELAEQAAAGRAQRVLADKTRDLLRQFDYVLLDCPPSLGLLTVNALALADEVIVPMQAHFLALQGLSKLLETVKLVRDGLNPSLTVAGVVLCMHEAQTVLAGEVTSDLRAFFEAARDGDVPWRDAVVFEPAVRRNIKLAESPSFGQSIFGYAGESNGARDYEALAASIARRPAAAPRGP